MTTVTFPVASSGNSTVAIPFSTLISTDISVTVLLLTFKVTLLEALSTYLSSPANVALIV